MRVDDLESYLDRVTRSVTDILGESLVGLYLHGSAALGSFTPGKSDIDLLAVVEETPDPSRLGRLGEALHPDVIAHPSPLDLHAVTRESLRSLEPCWEAWFSSHPAWGEFRTVLQRTEDRDLFLVFRRREASRWGEVPRPSIYHIHPRVGRPMDQPFIRTLRPGDEVELEAFLLPRLETSMFLISNLRAAGLEDRGEPYQGTYAAAWQAGRMVAVAAHYWNRVLLLQAPVHVDSVWRLAVEASGRPLSGVIGPSDQVAAVVQELGLQPSMVQRDQVEILYGLDLDELVVPARLARGELTARTPTPDDLDLLTQWQVGYALEEMKEPDTPETRTLQRAVVDRRAREGRIWILEDGGRPVAMGGFNARIFEAVQVGGVWTPPELRNRGYGRSVVAAALLAARAEGASKAILFTGQGNLPAQKAYEALGFRPIGSYRLFHLREALAVDAGA